MLKDEVKYDIRWSDAVTDDYILDFIKVHSIVFGGGLDRTTFERKYRDNIYGSSLMVVAYCNGEPCAARAFWRNDLGRQAAWQPVDTCVVAEYRGKGLFTEMTQRALTFLPSNPVLYNFPNQNSLPGYLKMGWRLLKQYRLRLFTTAKYEKEHAKQAPQDYVEWWFKGASNLRCVRRDGKWYVVRRLNKPFCYKILSRVSTPVFPVVRLALCFYESAEKTFYNSNKIPLSVVGRNVSIDVPVWKMDAID